MSNNKQSVRFFSFAQFHNKRPSPGSTQIRVEQLIKYWPEADLYKYGEHPETLIFQKVYCGQDYTFPIKYDGIRILDLCDPDWLEGAPIKQTIDGMDAITCSSQGIVDFVKQLTDKPVIHIPDRFDLKDIPKPKQHTDKAKTVLWFGYHHNLGTLKPAIPDIQRLDLKLLIISDNDPNLEQSLRQISNKITYKKYEQETVYKHMQTADFTIFPKGTRPRDKFKSNNKTVKSILAGLPVATSTADIISFMEAENRQKYIDKHYAIMKEQYDVKRSIEQYKELIDELKRSKA